MPNQQRPANDPLERKAAQIEQSREFIEASSFSGSEQEIASELSAFDQHPADFADVVEQRARDYTIKQMLEQEAAQIEEAQRRKAEGRYGICDNCGQQISPERLEARPEATLCIDCQRAQESIR